MNKYLLPIALGLAGMFVAHFLLFLLSIGFRLNYMPYIITYPTVYILLAFILARNYPNWWLSNVIFILLIPFVYWYILLWSDGKFHWVDAIKVTASSGMLLILPFTLVAATLISYMYKRKQPVQNIR